MNRLLINMKNKIDIINGSIDMIYKIQKGETIKFGENIDGALKFSITKKEDSHSDYGSILEKLFVECDNLQLRVNRMESSY
jgi:hypothetical protein